MFHQYNLKRYVEAQQNTYDTALQEIKAGKKQSHWMWFIFPQIAGLGKSEFSKFFAITDKNEATLFLEHPILGDRIIESMNVLLTLETTNAHHVFGSPDDKKLHSSVTLFSSTDNTVPVFKEVLDKFFDGKPDAETLRLL